MANAPFIDILFDSLPGPDGCRFIELEDPLGRSRNLGEWIEVPVEDGPSLWRLRITASDIESAQPLSENGGTRG